MGLALKSFVMPNKLVLDENSATDEYGKFIAETFERGFGATLGNSLRRVLISSLEGAALTSVKIEGASHEFSALTGVMEDVSEIIMNLKGIHFKLHAKTAKTLSIQVDKKGVITGEDIKIDDTVEIVNPKAHIATLTKKTSFKAELILSKGRGYVTAEQNKKDGLPIGTIALDSVFSPVKKVAFRVEDIRVGQITDYDRLIIEVWTNGGMTPQDAILYASNILQQQLNVFANFGKLPEEDTVSEDGVEPEDLKLYRRLAQPVTELELSVRSANCLSEARIKTIGELVSRSEGEMLKYRNFGKKSLTEISQILRDLGLGFGVQVDQKKLKAVIDKNAASQNT
jgi:DNA-directed RNA polymerase subunit alpha